MRRGNIDILLITGGKFGGKSETIKINNLLTILSNKNIYLITHCDKNYISKIGEERICSLRIEGNRFKQFVLSQIMVSRILLSLHRRDNIKIIMFAFGQDLQILPMILAKMISKKITIRSDGRPTVVLRKYLKRGSLIKRCLFKLIEEINYRLADIVLTECEYMISENNFQKYKSQTGSLFVDTYKFTDKTRLHNRRYEIGFIGRLVQEKGILNFSKALELLNGKFNVIIIGDCEEKNKVLDRIRLLKSKSTNRLDVEYVGWIEHDTLPSYLNETKIVVVPSYKEGLPNIVLESMACGCVVLATPVGGIPGVIKNGDTGFLLQSNHPEHIADKIIELLDRPKLLEKVSVNACNYVRENFGYEKTFEVWRKFFTEFALS